MQRFFSALVLQQRGRFKDEDFGACIGTLVPIHPLHKLGQGMKRLAAYSAQHDPSAQPYSVNDDMPVISGETPSSNASDLAEDDLEEEFSIGSESDSEESGNEDD